MLYVHASIKEKVNCIYVIEDIVFLNKKYTMYNSVKFLVISKLINKKKCFLHCDDSTIGLDCVTY